MRTGKLANRITSFGEFLPEALDFLVRKTGAPILFTGLGRVTVATLRHHIVNVVRMASQKEVIRIRARRVVAPVENVQSICDRAVMELIRNTVRANAATINCEDAVTKSRFATNPIPAFVITTLDNLLPISIRSRAQRLEPNVMTAEKANGLTLYIAAFGMGELRDWRGQTTATFAKFGVRKFGLGRLWSMLHGIGSLLTGIGQARDGYSRRLVFSRGFLV